MLWIKNRYKEAYLYLGVLLILFLVTCFLIHPDTMQILSKSRSSRLDFRRNLIRDSHNQWRPVRMLRDIRSTTARPLTDTDKLHRIADLLGYDLTGNKKRDDLESRKMINDILNLIDDHQRQGKDARDTVDMIYSVVRSVQEEKNGDDLGEVMNNMNVLENLVPKRLDKVKIGTYPFTRDARRLPSECPSGFHSRAEQSDWFRERYVDDVKMLMDLSDVEPRNFLDLQFYSLPFGYKRENRTLVDSIFHNMDHIGVYRGVRKQCLRCAVVGCGGILKGSRRGGEINAHDLVFRVNHARIDQQYVEDVGNKTDFYVFFPESEDVKRVAQQDPIYFYVPFKTYDLEYIEGKIVRDFIPKMCSNKTGKCWKLRNPQNVTSHNLRIVHPDFMRYVFVNFLNGTAYRPTTGALTVFLAVHMCDEVDLYGFGFDRRFSLHYYDEKFKNYTEWRTGAHDIDNERYLWQKLDEQKVIRWFKR
ncbi:ST3GAL1 [Branchiostoma lanceolatum]|uniref:alpha-N-acetylgalactosaminide alpha-2,6-sialyltransferase n=1 Tax=Branchiostoma lanceolatum TaxID=7740 RepID=A0A8K0EAS1_BRALA|nr:ST3GAL1 [Branchiostoma lanceolatum]